MNYRDKIISDLAEMACKQISAKVVRSLQKMTDGMQSGDDTSLKNIWEEICVQAQGEESVMWDVYLDTIKLMVESELEKLDVFTKAAIWLQTDEGMDWAADNEDQEAAAFSVDEITNYISQDFVLATAGGWTNRRIEKYLDSGSD